MKDIKTFLVYRHWRLDTLKPFYIGKGWSESRAVLSTGRNIYWSRIANKTECLVEVVARDLTEEDAFELEEFLISLYGRVNNNTGILCNMTDGGEGLSGLSPSKETRKKIGDANRNRVYSEESIRNITEGTKKAREANRVVYGSPEWKPSHKGNVKVLYPKKFVFELIRLNKTGTSVNTLAAKYQLNSNTIKSLIIKGGGEVIIYTNYSIQYIEFKRLYSKGLNKTLIRKRIGCSGSNINKFIAKYNEELITLTPNTI